MKKVDIIPGAIAAIAAEKVRGYGTNGYRTRSHGVEAVREGISAAPARIVDVGKWREQRQGACEIEFVNDGFTSAALVEIVDMAATFPEMLKKENQGYFGQRSGQPTMADRPGMPDGLKLTSKKVKWKRAVVATTSLIYPWEHWLKLREERLFALAEYAAYQKRNGVVLRELGELLVPVAATMIDAKGSTHDFSNYDVANYEFKYRVHLDVGQALKAGAFNGTTAQVQALYDEHVFLLSKLSCRVR